MENDPEEQASRWSSPANDQNQFLLLHLPTPAILGTITFGKFNKLHVCNLREFSVLAGPSEDCLVPVLHTGLRNDTEPETFTVLYKHSNPDMHIPCKFVKIIPLASHGSNFNYSIWYVELRGLIDTELVNRVKQEWQVTLDREAWRLCLDFIRRHPDPETKQIYTLLSNRVQVQVEEEHLRALFETITDKTKDLQMAEQLVVNMPEDLFADCDGMQYNVSWTPIRSSPWPSKRGGHQMVWDPRGELLWLFGGWDGERDLGDLWTFSPADHKWTCLQQDTRHHGGPCPRSCHKIAMDTVTRKIYVLGRFVEPDQRAHQPLNSELYVYDCENGHWSCASEDTSADGGPLLLYDHQMVIERQCRCTAGSSMPCKCPARLWVYGGKVVAASPSEPIYSGLWVCDLANGNRWRLVRPDDPSMSDLTATPMLRSRIGHCMLFDEEERTLHILHGQRLKDYFRYNWLLLICSDYYQYNVDTDTVVHYDKDVSIDQHGPPPGFTQRGCLISVEPGVKMLLLLSGLVREKHSILGQPEHPNQDTTQNALWALHLPTRKWTCLYQNKENDSSYWQRMKDIEPCPRYAHQLVSADHHGVFLFGGNPGDVSNPKERLDDMWKCGVTRRMDAVSVKQHLVYLIRRQQYAL